MDESTAPVVKTIDVSSSSSVIGFECEPPGRCWDRYLTIHGRRGYKIGINCDTCGFFFARLPGAANAPTGTTISRRLRDGIGQLDDELIENLKPILPVGRYLASLLMVRPQLVMPGEPGDYFVGEFRQLWGRRKPELETAIPYYRSRSVRFESDKALFEFIVPLVAFGDLDATAVASFKGRILSGRRPTAVAISVLDMQHRTNWPATLEPEVLEHWCLAHYLIDGHHKMLAAAQAGGEITLLSFLAVKQSIVTEDGLTRLHSLLVD